MTIVTLNYKFVLFKRILKLDLFFPFCIFVLLAALLPMESQAGTYNFYFNNSEQGDHSTASPQLSVNQEGKPVSNDSTATHGTGDAKPATAPNADEGEEETPPAQTAPTPPNPKGGYRVIPASSKWLRLSGGMSLLRTRTEYTYDLFSYNSDSYGQVSSKVTTEDLRYYVGFDIEATILANQYLGIGAFLAGSTGGVLGAELELNPFTFESPVSGSLLLGASAVGTSAKPHITAFVGGRFDAHINDSLSLYAALRYGFVSENFNYGLVSGGLSVYF